MVTWTSSAHRARRLVPLSLGVCACLGWSSLQCAGLVGITDIPGRDAGDDLGESASHDGFTPPADAPAGGPDGFSRGPDGPSSQDSPPPTGDAGLTYAPSNLGGRTFDAKMTGPLVLGAGESCLLDADYPGTEVPSCSGGTSVPGDIFGVTLANGAGEAVIYVFTDIYIASGASILIQGSLPTIIVALGSVTIGGYIDASADLYNSSIEHIPGERLTGPGIGGFNSSGPQGGGGGSFCGTGGSGAMGTGAVSGGSTPGSPYGAPSLVPLWGGSAGGGVHAPDVAGNASCSGGGAVQISASKSITIAAGGFITVNGAGGVAGGDESGEGGGSGGAILLEAPIITIAGVVEANGGEGSDPESDGANPPEDGGAAVEPGVAGGTGGAGENVNGGNGDPTDAGFGGGGGGTGRIRLNGTTVKVTGTVSPSLGSECATQGALP
jgi:hypothetical protein